MGHQTNYKECDKCKGVTITTIAFGKTIKTSNCKCKEINEARKFAQFLIKDKQQKNGL